MKSRSFHELVGTYFCGRMFTLAILAVVYAGRCDTMGRWRMSGTTNTRMEPGDVIVNTVNPGVHDAIPHSVSYSTISELTLENFPSFTSAFPSRAVILENGMGVTNTSALHFPGTAGGTAYSGGCLTIEDSADFHLSRFTVEMFFKLDGDTTAWRVLAVKPIGAAVGSTAKASAESWGIRVATSGTTASDSLQWRFTMANGVQKSGQPCIGRNLNDGRWHHVAMTVDDATPTAPVAKLYLDYKQISTITLSGPVYYVDNAPIIVGATSQTSAAFNGWIDELRITNQALAPENFMRVRDAVVCGDPDTMVWYRGDMIDWFGNITTNMLNSADYGTYSGALSVTGDGAPQTFGDNVSEETIRPHSRSAASYENGTSFYNTYTATSTANGGRLAFDEPDNILSTNSFTAECIFKTDGQIGDFIPLFRKNGAGNVLYNLGFRQNGVLSATLGYAVNVSTTIETSERYDDSTWHHAALVLDRERGTLRLYVDYELKKAATVTRDLGTSASSTFVGSSGTGNQFKGWIDEFRLTRRALRPTEFIVSGNVVPPSEVDDTLVWCTSESGLGSDVLAYTAQSPSVAPVTASGTVPSLSDVRRGDFIKDGMANLLRTNNLKSVSYSGGVLKFTDVEELQAYDAQTVEFLVKAGSQTPWAGLVRLNASATSADTPVWAVSFDGGNDASSSYRHLQLRFDVVPSGGTTRTAYSHALNDVVIGDDTWHHVAFAFEPKATDDTVSHVTVWVDYVQRAAFDLPGKVTFPSNMFASLWTGASSSTTSWFVGNIDELRISKGVLDPLRFLHAEYIPGTTLLFR